MTDEHELPVALVFKGVEIYALQSPERVEEAKRQITKVIRMQSVESLYDFACNGRFAPEARHLAKRKCLEFIEQRQRSPIDVDLLQAATVGIERATTPLGREIGHLDAERSGVPWPAAWLPE
jgi:hypothetical protein